MNATTEQKNKLRITIILLLIGDIFCTTGAVILLAADIPIFVYLNLIIALIVLYQTHETEQFGLKILAGKEFLNYTIMNMLGILLIYIIVEPITHTYEKLIQLSLTEGVDVTFGWIQKYPGIAGIGMVLLFSLFISIFGEELMFRGILEGYLLKKTSYKKAILLQAVIFAIPQTIVLLVMPLVQGLIYILSYVIIATGIINGYIVYKSHSIGPSVVAAAVVNVLMVLAVYPVL